MKSSAIVLATGLLLTGCALKGSDTGEPADGAINGEAAYFEYCARCHEDGVFGAPRRGQLEDWKNRSQLWQAVLMEHVGRGPNVLGVDRGSEVVVEEAHRQPKQPRP